MFEGWVANILKRALGAYVKESCFSAERVDVGVWSGFVAVRAAMNACGLVVAARPCHRTGVSVRCC